MAQESHYNQLIGLLQPPHWSIAHGKTGNIRLCAGYGVVPDSITRYSTELEREIPYHLVRVGESQARLTTMAQHHAVVIAGDDNGRARVRCCSVFPFERASTYTHAGIVRDSSAFVHQISRSRVATISELATRLSGSGSWSFHSAIVYSESEQVFAATERFIAGAVDQGLRPGDTRVAQDLITAIQSTPPLRSR